MGGNKKGGKGGGKGKKKKKEQEEKDVLTEVDREYYEVQLVDLNRKLTRLRNRTAELETNNTELEEKLRKLDEDRADIIAYLKKTLMTKTNEMSELQERLDGLKQSMESGIVKYKEKIAQMEQDYKNMHEELTSEIKLLMGKLNSLEEFRTQRDELMAKFATQEEEMQEQERRHKRNLYECERKFILEKDKLKKQMETRLLQLSIQFQEATDVRIAATTHRMIRENIAINNELNLIQEIQKEMMETYDKMKQKSQKAQLEVKLREEERDKALNKSLTQVKIIEKLIAEHKEYENKLEQLENLTKECAMLKEKLAATEEQLEDANNEIKALNKRVSDGQTNAAKLYADVAALKLNSRRLYVILHKAVIAVKEAVRIHEEPELDEALIVSKRDDLLSNLLQLLNRAEMTEKERSMISKTVGAYETGDLGFIPKSRPASEMSKEERKPKEKEKTPKTAKSKGKS